MSFDQNFIWPKGHLNENFLTGAILPKDQTIQPFGQMTINRKKLSVKPFTKPFIEKSFRS
jgi:hypothetical protein